MDWIEKSTAFLIGGSALLTMLCALGAKTPGRHSAAAAKGHHV